MLLQMAGVALLLAGLMSFVLTRTAGADSGTTVTPSGAFTANTPFSSGQLVDVSVTAAAVVAAGMTNGHQIAIEECAVPTGGGDPGSPTTVGVCDGNTHQGPTVTVSTTSGINLTNYPIYALPDANFGESGTSPVCDLTHQCLLYIGQDQTSSSAPHLWSQPFYVDPGDGTDSGANPGDGSAPTVGAVSQANSTVVASPSSVVADGGDASTITVTLLDSSSQALAGKSVTLRAAGGSSTITPLATGGALAGTTDSSGMATFSVNDSSVESVTYSADDTTDGITLNSTASVSFALPAVVVSSTTVTATPNALPADGTSSSTVTVQLRDQAGVVVPGKTVSLNVGSHAVATPVTPVTDKSGTATFTVTDATVETVTVIPTDVTDANLLLPTTTIHFQSTVAVAVDPNLSTVTGPSSATLGTGTATVTVTLLGAGSTPVANKSVELTSTNPDALISPSNAPTAQDGTVTFTVGDLTAEPITFAATDITDANLKIVQTVTIGFAAATESAASAVTESPANGTAPADGTSTVNISITLVDTGSTPITGHQLQVTPSSGSSATVTPLAIGGSAGGTTNAQGLAQFQVRDEVAETSTLTITDVTVVNGSPLNFVLTAQPPVTFTPGIGDGNESTVTASPAAVAPGGNSTVTVTIFDHLGNPVPGTAVSLAAAQGTSATVSPSSQTTDKNGAASFTVTDSAVEAVQFTATDTTDSVPITESATVTFGSPVILPDMAACVMVGSSSSVPGDGTHTATLTVELFDGSGQPLSGKQVSLNPSGGTSVITAVTGATAQARSVIIHRDGLLPRATTSTVTATTGSDGSASFLVSDTAAEAVTYTATDVSDSLPITGQSLQITFTTASITTTTSTTSPTTSTTTPSSVTSGSTGTDTGSGSSLDSSGGSSSSGSSSSGGLAFTGSGALVPWLVGAGLLFLLLGTVGRRVIAVRGEGERRG